MRTRKEIWDSIPEMHYRGTPTLSLEVLLDIRDILSKKEEKKPKTNKK